MTMRAVASAHFSEEYHLDAMYRWHRQHYPLMAPQDVVKLFFQARLGCGHLLGEEELVAKRIADEENHLSPCPQEALCVPLGPDYIRLNLRRAMAEGISPLWIARMMKLSQPVHPFTRADVVAELGALHDPAVAQAAQRLIDEPDWLPSHTAAYHAAYAPAYRVIGKKCAALLPVLQAMSHIDQERVLICIDGPCGSGKTTLAALLQGVLDAALVPMDDFFLPHSRKTPERLAQPGGNADWERLVEEFLTPWLKDGIASYRPYTCHADAFAEAVTVPSRQYTIIEGSYSLMPEIRKHADLCIFLQVTPEEQQRRILQRNGAKMLQMFQSRWIPLEQAYFDAFHLPDQNCLVLSTEEQLV